MISAGIIGASGYTGAELVRLLSLHPEVEISVITSRQYEGQPLKAAFPHLAGTDLDFVNHEETDVSGQAELFFTALPHAASMEAVGRLADAGKRVIDLSADFRFADASVYEATYGAHSRKDLLPDSVYGLTELYRNAIATCRIIGNPGCYPTSSLLPLAPLIREGVISTEGIIIDAKSGVTGAGRAASQATHYCEVNESMKAYKVAAHRHTPEIESQLAACGDGGVRVIFTPHLTPMSRGIFSTIYATPVAGCDAKRVEEVWRNYYEDAPFVGIAPEGVLPDSAFVRGSNRCMLGVRDHAGAGRLIILSTIDNLIKGASGQAVQNMNVMMGWEETLGLETQALFP